MPAVVLCRREERFRHCTKRNERIDEHGRTLAYLFFDGFVCAYGLHLGRDVGDLRPLPV
jgi:hypothetical protein